MNSNWLTVQGAKSDDGPVEMRITGTIGSGADDFSEVTEQMFLYELDCIPKNRPISVVINSPGGSVSAGVSIYHALKKRGPTVTCAVRGIAASSASLVALGGHKTTMATGSLMMIHSPWGITLGSAAEHRKEAEVLEQFEAAMADIYSGETGQPIAAVKAAMSEETWFNPDQAKDWGLVDEVEKTVVPVAMASLVGYKFRNLPKGLLQPTDVRQPDVGDQRPNPHDLDPARLRNLDVGNGIRANQLRGSSIKAFLAKLIEQRQAEARERARQAGKPVTLPVPASLAGTKLQGASARAYHALYGGPEPADDGE